MPDEHQPDQAEEAACAAAGSPDFSEPPRLSHGDPEPMGSASGPARDLPAVPSPGPADPVVAVPLRIPPEPRSPRPRPRREAARPAAK